MSKNELKGDLAKLDLRPTKKGQMAILEVATVHHGKPKTVKAIAFDDMAVDLTASLNAFQNEDGSYHPATKVALSGFFKKWEPRGKDGAVKEGAEAEWQFQVKGFTPSDPDYASPLPEADDLPAYLTEEIPMDAYDGIYGDPEEAAGGVPVILGEGAISAQTSKHGPTPSKTAQKRRSVLLSRLPAEGDGWRGRVEDVQWLVFALVKQGVFVTPAEAFMAWLLRSEEQKQGWMTPPESEETIRQELAGYFA